MIRHFQKRYDRAVQEAESVHPHLEANSEGQPVAWAGTATSDG